jgi:hypothetical protein
MMNTHDADADVKDQRGWSDTGSIVCTVASVVIYLKPIGLEYEV